MNNIIKKTILNILEKRGFQKKPIGEEARLNLYNQMKLTFLPLNEKIVSVIFSKDRAMQLDAFLASYFENVDNFSNIKVLYYVSNNEHNRSYNDLKKIYAEFPVEFILEKDFRKDLIQILESVEEDRIMFYVDDMLFTRKLDYNWLNKINPLEDVVSLSRGKDLIYSTVLSKELKTPIFKKINENLYQFFWNEISEFSDWSYPIGVSGYMFSRREIVAMMKVIQFKAPNSLEYNLQQFLIYFINRSGICLEKVATPCVHTNITQTEGYNNILGHYTVSELLDLWNKNLRINYKEFFELENSIAEIKKYNFIERG